MSELNNLDDLVKSVRELSTMVSKMAKDWKSINKDSAEVAKNIGKSGKGKKGSAMPASLAGFSYVPAGEKPPMAAGSTSPFAKMNKNPSIHIGEDGAFGPATPAQFAAQSNRNAEIWNRRQAGAFGLNQKAYSAYSAMSPKGQQFAQGGIYGLSDTLGLFQGMSNSLATFMPGMQDTMDRASSNYAAGVYSRMSGRDVSAQTRNLLAGGMTSKGSDARVAQFLSGRGMKVGSATYNQTLGSVSNAAKYMNISNEEAAASVEGMTSAKGAAETLRNFGIYTADLGTGKEKTQGQIFEELAQRLTAGRGQATAEETQASIRRGALGVTVDSFFQGDEQGAQMFKQYMIDRAGNKSSGKSAADAWDKGTTGTGLERNPLQAQMNMNTSDTKAMDDAQENYVQGIEQATRVLSALNVAAGGLAKSFAGIPNALQQTLFGHGTVQGMVGAADTMVGWASKGISSISGLLAEAGPLNPLAAPIAGVVGATMGASLVGATAMYAGSGLLGTGGNSAAMAQSSSGAGIGGTGTGGNSGGMFDSSLITSGHGVNSAWGAKRTDKKGNVRYHGGTDYDYRTGNSVRAIADGKVHNVVTGRKNNPGSGSLGNQVAILHTAGNGEKYTSVYGHLSTVSVTKGQMVKKGDVIGKSGNTGDSDGPHLHFELRKGVWTTGAGSKSPSSWVTMDQADKILPSGSVNDVAGGTEQSSTDNSSTTPSASTSESALLTEAGKLNLAANYSGPVSQFQTKGEKSLNLLKGLYSGKTEDIMASMQSMSANMGVTGEMWNYFTNNSSDYTNSPGNQQGPGGGFKPGSPVNNNVSIVVQVPDVTAADATKFAQLVKSYLDQDSLLSSTGGA